MKKYHNYINESSERTKEEIDSILEECSECVDLIKSTGKLFWRGINDREDDNIIQLLRNKY